MYSGHILPPAPGMNSRDAHNTRSQHGRIDRQERNGKTVTHILRSYTDSDGQRAEIRQEKFSAVYTLLITRPDGGTILRRTYRTTAAARQAMNHNGREWKQEARK